MREVYWSYTIASTLKGETQRAAVALLAVEASFTNSATPISAEATPSIGINRGIGGTDVCGNGRTDVWGISRTDVASVGPMSGISGTNGWAA